MSEGASKSLDTSVCTITCSEELKQLPGYTSGFVPKQDCLGVNVSLVSRAEAELPGAGGRGWKISVAFLRRCPRVSDMAHNNGTGET